MIGCPCFSHRCKHTHQGLCALLTQYSGRRCWSAPSLMEKEPQAVVLVRGRRFNAAPCEICHGILQRQGRPCFQNMLWRCGCGHTHHGGCGRCCTSSRTHLGARDRIRPPVCGPPEAVTDRGMDNKAAERRLALGRMVQAALLAGVPFGVAALSMVVRFVPPTWFTLMAAKITQVSGGINSSHCHRRVSTHVHNLHKYAETILHACVA